MVPFSASITIPFNYEPGSASCKSPLPPQPLLTANASARAEYQQQEQQYQQCITKYLYPPAQMNGSSTISYKLLGLGPHPFPREELVTQGNDSVVVYFKGESIEAAEYYLVPVKSLNPPGLVKIENASLNLDNNDFLQFSAVVVNISPELMALQVRMSGTGVFDANSTSNGIILMGGGSVGCPRSLAPKSECLASISSLSSTGGNLTQFSFTVEVVGGVGGQWFLYQQHFVLANPYTGLVNAEWVAAFMRSVNTARNGTTLQEEKSLDDFAQIRYKTSISNFTISDYGFSADYSRFFSAVGPQVGEDALFTGKYLPAQYASVLSQTAPGHWSVLMGATYTKYGYFVGEGPTVVAREPCPVAEFPNEGVNETAYLTSHGCGYDIVQGPWVIIEVGN